LFIGRRPSPSNPKVAFLAVLEEPAVAGLVLREQAPHLGDHRVFVLAHAEVGAVAPADFVIGIDGAQIDILVEIAPAFGPELAEHLRHGHDGGAQIEPVPVPRDRRSAPARPVQPVQKRDLVALGAQPHGRRQTAQPGTDHDGARRMGR
jgi:hypothetical protein